MSARLGVKGSTAIEDAEPTTSDERPRQRRNSAAAASRMTAAAASPPGDRPAAAFRANDLRVPGLRQRGLELRGAGVAVGRCLGQCAGDDALDRLGGHRPQGADRGRGLRHRAGDDHLGRRPGEGRIPGEHLVENAAEGIDVGASVQLARARRLLRAHVVHGADGQAGGGEPSPAGERQRARDAEVRQHTLAGGHHDVVGLHVPVDHAVGVRVGQRGGHVAREPERLVHRKLPLAPQAVPQRLALDIGHHIEGRGRPGPDLQYPGVEQRQDVGMLEPCGQADLQQEAVGADADAERGVEDLQGDRPIVAEVVSQVDGRHPTPAELPLHAIAIAERGVQRGEEDR